MSTERPEPDPGFCDGIGFDNPDWPGPWGCGTVMQVMVDGVMTTHMCALSYDHVDYLDEPHVCTLGHRWDVYRPRRRWRDRLLRRRVEKLRRRPGPWFDMTEAPGPIPDGLITTDAVLTREEAEAWRQRWQAEASIKASLRIQEFDDRMKVGDE